MCGLFGVVGKNGHTAGLIEAMRQLATFSVFRGADSTGLGSVNAKKREYTVDKAACPSYEFLERRHAISILTEANNTSVIIGHTRAATRGKVRTPNAHPFYEEGTYGGILLAHNGYAEGYDAKEYDVDSQWVAAMIAEHGPDWVKTLRGEYALTWHDFETNTLWMARNTDRPLFLAVVPAGKDMHKLVWASEKEMLACALVRNKVPITQMYELKANALHEFDPQTATLIRQESYPATQKFAYNTQGWVRGNVGPAATTVSVTPGMGSMYQQGANCQYSIANAWDGRPAGTRNKLRVKLKMRSGFNALENTYWQFSPDPADEVYGTVPQIRMCSIPRATEWLDAQIIKESGWLTLEIMGAEYTGPEATKKLVTLHCMVPRETWNNLIGLSDKKDDVISSLPEPEPSYDKEDLLTMGYSRGG